MRIHICRSASPRIVPGGPSSATGESVYDVTLEECPVSISSTRGSSRVTHETEAEAQCVASLLSRARSLLTRGTSHAQIVNHPREPTSQRLRPYMPLERRQEVKHLSRYVHAGNVWRGSVDELDDVPPKLPRLGRVVVRRPPGRKGSHPCAP